LPVPLTCDEDQFCASTRGPSPAGLRSGRSRSSDHDSSAVRRSLRRPARPSVACHCNGTVGVSGTDRAPGDAAPDEAKMGQSTYSARQGQADTNCAANRPAPQAQRRPRNEATDHAPQHHCRQPGGSRRRPRRRGQVGLSVEREAPASRGWGLHHSTLTARSTPAGPHAGEAEMPTTLLPAADLRPGQRFRHGERVVTASRFERDRAIPRLITVRTVEGPCPVFMDLDVVILADWISTGRSTQCAPGIVIDQTHRARSCASLVSGSLWRWRVRHTSGCHGCV
jgi:hypothetical protein